MEGGKECPISEALQKTSLMGWAWPDFADGAPISEVLLSTVVPPHERIFANGAPQ